MAGPDRVSPDTIAAIRQRLNDVEADVARPKQQLRPAEAQANQPWWVQRAGAFAGDPGFEEMNRLGQQWRAQERAHQPDDRNAIL
jgi:hypothetical protein